MTAEHWQGQYWTLGRPACRAPPPQVTYFGMSVSFRTQTQRWKVITEKLSFYSVVFIEACRPRKSSHSQKISGRWRTPGLKFWVLSYFTGCTSSSSGFWNYSGIWTKKTTFPSFLKATRAWWNMKLSNLYHSPSYLQNSWHFNDFLEFPWPGDRWSHFLEVLKSVGNFSSKVWFLKHWLD